MKELGTLGQSLWLDYIRRDLIASGELRRLIEEDGLRGMTRPEQDVKGTRWVLDRLPELGISIDTLTRQLEDEGVEKFIKPFDKLMEAVAQRSARHLTRHA